LNKIRLKTHLLCLSCFIYTWLDTKSLCENMASSTKLEVHNVLQC